MSRRDEQIDFAIDCLSCIGLVQHKESSVAEAISGALSKAAVIDARIRTYVVSEEWFKGMTRPVERNLTVLVK